MTSGIATIAMLALLLWTFRATPKRHLARFAAAAAAILTFNEALLGALLVLLGHTANDRSPARGAYLSLHLANTLLLLAALALCAHFASRTAAFDRTAVRFAHLPLILAGTASLLVVGVTGSLAALGDTLFPATSLRAAFAQDLLLQGGWLVRLRLLHPLSALAAGVFVGWMIREIVFRDTLPSERRLGILVILLLVLQCVLGIADVLLLAPVGMQVLHLLGADLLWISLVVLSARICVQPVSA
jgi:cytochrome c oxidase assembly protein subunit 15